MLYSVGLSVAASFSRAKFWLSIAAFGTVATALSVFDVVKLFIPYISFLGISVPSLCGIYICDFFFVNRQNYSIEELESLPAYRPSAFIAWLAGFAIGWLAVSETLVLTTVPAFDSMIGAALVYVLLSSKPLRRLFAGRP